MPGFNKEKLKEELEAREHQIIILHKISRLLSLRPHLKLERILHVILQAIGERLDVRRLAIWLVDKENKYFYIAAAYNMPSAYIDFTRSQAGRIYLNQKSALAVALNSRKNFLMKNLPTSIAVPKRYKKFIKGSGLKMASVLCVPLLVREKAIGTINFYFSTARESIPEPEDRLASIIANQIAAVAQNIKDYSELKKKANELEKAQKNLVKTLAITKMAKARSEEEKNKTQTIINNFTDGILIFEADKKLSLINPQAGLFLEADPQKIINEEWTALKELKSFDALIAFLEKKPGVFFRKELKLSSDLVLETTSVVFSRSGAKKRRLVILHDITREKAIDKMKSDFISIAAHQLRTPLTSIKWAIKMALDGDAGPLTKAQAELVKWAYGSNERIIRLVNDLLNVSRIEEGRFGFNFVRINFKEVLDAVLESQKGPISQRHISLIISKPDPLPETIVDKEKLILALQNLLDNAVKYTPENGKIEINIEILDNYLSLSIDDNGVGVPKKDQPKLFSKFFRASNVIKMETEGSGFGLFIAKNIINRHGGDIYISSQEGKGTKVIVSLPLFFKPKKQIFKKNEPIIFDLAAEPQNK